MTCKDRLEAYLRAEQVPFQMQHHPLAYTAQEVAAAEHVPGKLVAKVVMVEADGRRVMLVLPATRRVDLARAARTLGARDARLATEAEFAATFPDCEVGAMPPFGTLYGVPVYVDQTLTEDEEIVCAAGTNTDSIRLRYADFARLVQPTVGAFAQPA